ncbi:MAG: hypothetical protein ACFFDC_18780 [Promethearchaeota archaeon]
MFQENVRKQELNRKEKTKKVKEERTTPREDHLENQLADRALLLLSFKDTSTQNLRYILNVLGIRTLDEKKKILLEIYRLIREGIVYVPRGLPQLIDPLLDANKNSVDGEDIYICLLRSYEDLIKEIQNDITRLQTSKNQNMSK